MATTVGEVVVDIRAKVERLSSDINSGKAIVSRGMRDIQNAAQAVQGYLGSLGVNAFAGYIKSAIDAAGALYDLSQKTGISASELSALDYAAKMSGTNITGVANALKKLSTGMYDAAQSTDQNANAFKMLGIQITDASGGLRSAHDVMLDVADRFSGMSDGAEKTALAVKLFGRAGVDMIPFLNQGAEGIKALEDTAHALGLTLTDEAAASMEALGDSLDTIGMAGQGMSRQLASALTPALTQMANTMLEAAKQGGGMSVIIDGLVTGLNALLSVVFGVVAAFDILVRGIIATFSVMDKVKSLDFAGAMQDIEFAARDTNAIMTSAGAKINAIWSKQASTVKEVAKETKATTTEIKLNTAETQKQADKIADVTRKLDDERKMLGMTGVAAEIYKQQTAAGVTANSEAGRMIAEKVRLLDEEKTALELNEEQTKRSEAALKEHKDALTSDTEALQKRVNELQLENQTTGMSKTAIEQLMLTRLLERQAVLEATIASKGLTAERSAERDAIAQQIALQKQLVTLVQAGEVVEAQKAQAEAAGKAWADVASDIESALTDALMRGFESGKGMMESLRDYIVNAFKSTVVKVIVQGVMGGVAGLIPGMANASGGGAAGGGGNILSTLTSIGSFLKGGPSGWMSAISGGLQTYGSALYGSIFEGASALGMDWLAQGALNKSSGYLFGSGGGNLATLGADVLGGFAGTYAAGALFDSREQATGGLLGVAGGILGSATPLGPVGAAIGAFIGESLDRILGGSDFSGKRVKLGVITGTGAAGQENERTLASGLRIGDITRRTDDAGLTPEQVQQYNQTFDLLDATLTDIARSTGAKVDLSGVTLKGPRQPYDGGLTPEGFFGSMAKGEIRDTAQAAPANFVRAWLDAVGDELPKRVRDFMANGDGAKTAEELVAAFGFIADIDRLLNIDVVGDATKAAAEQAEAAQMTMIRAYDAASTKVRDLAADFDGSAESMQALSTALVEQKTVAAEMAAAYAQLKGAIANTFGETIDTIKNSLLTNEQIVTNNRDKIAELFTQLGTALDPGDIASISGQINQLVNATWGMLSEEQQKAEAPAWIKLLQDTQELAGDRIDAGMAALTESEDALRNAVDEGLAALNGNVQGLTEQQQSTAEVTVSAIRNVSHSVRAGTDAIVNAVNTVTNSVAAVASAVNGFAAAQPQNIVVNLTLDPRETNV